jgi:hypothetical protein
MLNDRLTIAVGTNIGIQSARKGNKLGNALENVSLDYAISRDGRYLIRVFRKNEYEGIVDGYIVESGISFIISIDYNKLKEFLQSRKQRLAAAKNNPNQ